MKIKKFKTLSEIKLEISELCNQRRKNVGDQKSLQNLNSELDKLYSLKFDLLNLDCLKDDFWNFVFCENKKTKNELVAEIKKKYKLISNKEIIPRWIIHDLNQFDEFKIFFKGGKE